MNKIKVAMCDDAIDLCQNVKNIFKYTEQIELVSYCSDLEACFEMVRVHKPDILLLDIEMSNGSTSIHVIPDIMEENEGLKIIMLSGYSTSDYIFDSIVNGASDYIVKSCSNAELVEKIIAVYNDTASFSTEIFAKFKKKSQEVATAHKSLIYIMDRMITLSPNELEILKDLYNGNSYNEIAQKRFVEATTIRSMGSRIMRKFKVKSMNELLTSLHQSKVFDVFFN